MKFIKLTAILFAVFYTPFANAQWDGGGQTDLFWRHGTPVNITLPSYTGANNNAYGLQIGTRILADNAPVVTGVTWMQADRSLIGTPSGDERVTLTHSVNVGGQPQTDEFIIQVCRQVNAANDGCVASTDSSDGSDNNDFERLAVYGLVSAVILWDYKRRNPSFAKRLSFIAMPTAKDTMFAKASYRFGNSVTAGLEFNKTVPKDANVDQRKVMLKFKYEF